MHHHLIAALLGLVEGLTEFLPVSSTGHLILISDGLDFRGPLADCFNVFVQMGAMLAVVVFYRRRFLSFLRPPAAPGFSGYRGIALLALTSLPALVVGKLAHHEIKDHLFHPTSVAMGLAIGAVAILLIEQFARRDRLVELDRLDWKTALGIGLIQCAALWPGISRSAATILGAILLGLSRRAAAEYSFFAAVPILTAAVLYDTWQNWPILTREAIPFFTTGFIVAFFSAWVAIRFLIQYVSHHSFRVFAWYRLVLAAVVLAWLG